MVIESAFIFLLVIAALIFAAVRFGKYVLKTQARPNYELAHAMRLLDRILAFDKAVPSLPSDIQTEARSLVSSYYKEIEST